MSDCNCDCEDKFFLLLFCLFLMWLMSGGC